uniref:Uncharacterized protein n=1 Tax=Romanomermis culicivorax TaxID=13658 RepID=A0A915HDC0_ROMCU
MIPTVRNAQYDAEYPNADDGQTSNNRGHFVARFQNNGLEAVNRRTSQKWPCKVQDADEKRIREK